MFQEGYNLFSYQEWISFADKNLYIWLDRFVLVNRFEFLKNSGQHFFIVVKSACFESPEWSRASGNLNSIA